MRPDFCGNCDFYQDGECRRFPPAVVPILADNQTQRYEYPFLYPQVLKDTPRCGEFKDDIIHRS